jgi:CheY-like chemotaxis protein
MTGQGQGRTILVADDEPEVLDLLRMMLEWEGYRVLDAADGLQALEKAKSQCPDLILLDVRMPKMSGLTVLDRLQENPAMAEIPVIMLSVVTTYPEVRTALQRGAIAYLSKPFEFREMIHMVERVLSTNQDARQVLREQALQNIGQP